MTNKIAIVLGLVIAAILLSDLFYFGWDLHVFLGRKLYDLTEYLAFWR